MFMTVIAHLGDARCARHRPPFSNAWRLRKGYNPYGSLRTTIERSRPRPVRRCMLLRGDEAFKSWRTTDTETMGGKNGWNG